MTAKILAIPLCITAQLVLGASALAAHGRATDGATAPPGTPQAFQQQPGSRVGTRMRAPGRPPGIPQVFQQSTLAGQGAGTPQELTALDYFQIQQLVAKYARFIDTCSNNGYDYADLYTPDGAFRAERNGKVSAGSVGREKLAEVSGGGSRGCKNVGW